MPVTSRNKSRTRFFAIRFARMALLALLLFASCAAALRAQAIQIKLVNGETGRPVAGICVGVVGVWLTNNARVLASIPTDKSGVARLRLTQKDDEVDISYSSKLGCGRDGAINPVLKYANSLSIDTYYDDPSCAFPQSMPNARWKEMDFSTQEVLQHGVVSANTCGKVTASPQPGELILFVRSRTFQEKVSDFFNNLD
jgi:hypothetical protein